MAARLPAAVVSRSPDDSPADRASPATPGDVGGGAPDSRAVGAAVDALLAWFAVHARDLPWRRTADPYAVLVSEVMLQQTQVARVVPRYLAWLERWPTVEALAAAPVADVLREWVGLGYNRRALALREAAVVVARDGWPEDLTALPGVGAYTAAAVGAFAFGRDGVALDTNVRRLFSRLGFALRPAPGSGAVFNQATMELGALVCTAREARCGACPVASWCGSRGAVAAPVRKSAGGVRFQDTDRWARGRVVAALAAGTELPELAAERLERVLAGLAWDGLVVLEDGSPRLPAA